MYVTVWEFTVRPGSEREFEALYGPGGAWVALFRTGSGYLGTELLRPIAASRRYLTIDRWSTAEAYAAFRNAHAGEYRALDARGDALTEGERPVGEFMAGACRGA